jgi:glycosyltransferase involved in cell wall biosynthesis
MAMRVLHILNDVTDRGNGIVNTAVDLALEQARQGLVVSVVSAGGGYKPLLENAGVQHFTLDQSRRPAQLLHAIRSLGILLSEFRPDVVHAHMCTGLLLAWLWKHFRHFVLIGHVHNVHDRQSVVMALADRVIAASQSVAATMAVQGIPKRKIRVVLNRTLNSPRCPSLAEIEPPPLHGPSIVTVCGMNHRKGIAELIAAFERLGSKAVDAHLYLVGDGPDREQFERQARASSRHSHIHFEGYQALPQAYMLSADVFVLASRRESFGLVLIEARQAGCAIVATDVDGVSEALDGGRAGLLVPPGDVNALAQALGRMLDDEQERSQWRSKAKSGIANFHVERMASEIKTVYDEPLRGGCRRDLRGELILK